ncbi:IPT/TIG domain-containing protein [Algoriphagus aestuarii]|nr:IPT/TIG domain-containing protein [Algoriphagus aestuarii]
MRKLLSLSLLILLFMGWACTEDEPDSVILVTEEVLYTSSENVRILGRLITNQTINLSDHGFYFSEDENFSSPIIISLGAKEGPGRFIGESNGFTNSKTYYAKAFMDLGGEIQFGNTIELKTLSPVINSFSPSFGLVGNEMVILGQNFTEDTRVFFGDTEGVITKIDFESRLHVTIPPASNVSVPIKVVVQDKNLTFPVNFEYRIGTYELVSKFPEAIKLYDPVYYNRGNGLFIGLGTVSKSSFYQKFQRFDLQTKTWEELAFNGSPRAFAFQTGNYFGGGTAGILDLPYPINYSFYKINESGFERLDDLPFPSLGSISFEDGGFLYVLGSQRGNPLAFRRYNPTTRQWTELDESPAAFSIETAFFMYQRKLFVLDKQANLWEYSIVANTWRVVSTFPGKVGQGYGMGEVVGDKAYMGLFKRDSEVWELDLNQFTWKRKNDIPGIAADITIAHYVADGFIYIMRVPDNAISGNYPMNLYKFDPNGL